MAEQEMMRMVRRYQKDRNVGDLQVSTAGKWEPTEVLVTRTYLERQTRRD